MLDLDAKIIAIVTVHFRALRVDAASLPEITRETTFDRLDADSLDWTEIAMDIDEQLDVALTVGEDGEPPETVGDLIDAVAAVRQARA